MVVFERFVVVVARADLVRGAREHDGDAARLDGLGQPAVPVRVAVGHEREDRRLEQVAVLPRVRGRVAHL